MRYKTIIHHNHDVKIYEIVIMCYQSDENTAITNVVSEITSKHPHNYYITHKRFTDGGVIDEYIMSIMCWNNTDYVHVCRVVWDYFMEHLNNEPHKHTEKLDHIRAELDAQYNYWEMNNEVH